VGIHQNGIYLGVMLGSLGVGIVVGTKSLPLAILFLMLFGVGWGFFETNNMPILSQIVRPDQRAAGYGLMNLASISCGGLADVGFGRLVLQIRPHEKT
jgi:MFS family permease